MTRQRIWLRLRWLLLRGTSHRHAASVALLVSIVLLLAAWARYGRGDDADAARTQREQAGGAPSEAAAEQAPEQSGVRQFLASLPGPDDAADAVQALFDEATRAGLTLPRGSYRLQPEPGAQWQRYRMMLPVRGHPMRVQHFVHGALKAVPALAVESIQFKRDELTPTIVEARIQWVLFVREREARP